MRYAIFVDAGYLYAQGSMVLGGRRLPRQDVNLNLSAVKQKLLETAAAKVSGATLLRIYWYDGLLGNRQTPAQEQLANVEGIKLRLGVVNVEGRQKGVDALILTDLMELARNHAISDVILLSGDEDMRVGVQLVQSFGILVHLVGIEPSRGSQSAALIQEADTHTEWSKADIETMMTLRQPLVKQTPPVETDPTPSTPLITEEPGPQESTEEAPPEAELSTRNQPDYSSRPAEYLESVVREFVAGLQQHEVQDIASLPHDAMIPPGYDRRLLGMCGVRLDRELAPPEKVRMRVLLREMARQRVEQTT